MTSGAELPTRYDTKPESNGLPFPLPSGWQAQRLKHVAEVRVSNVDKKSVEGEQSVRLCNYVDVYKNDFIRPEMEFMAATASDAQIQRFTLRAGDVLITKDSETWTDIAVPAYVEQNMPGVLCGYHLAHLRPKVGVIDGRFLFRAIGAEGIADQFRVSANGITRFGLSIDDISNGLIPIPPLSEQRAIAEFLDRKTALIDEVIEKKQRLVARLNERRRRFVVALVEEVSSAPRVRLKFISQSITSGSRGWAEHYSDDGAVFLRIGNLSRDHIDLKLEDVQRVTPPRTAEIARTRVHGGDLLISVTAYIGSIGVVPDTFEEAYVNQHTALIRLREGIERRWVAYILLSEFGQNQFRQMTQGGTKEGIGLDDVGNLLIVAPHPKEQRAHVTRIDAVVSKTRMAVSLLCEQIRKLADYRQTIISAAVIGRLSIPSAPADVVAPKQRQANKHFHRAVLAAEIVDRHRDTSKFGRVKLQKTMNLAELHLNLAEIQSNPVRAAAGPFDNQMMRSVHKQLAAQKWFQPVKGEKAYRYEPMERHGNHRRFFERYWADRRDRFDALMALIKPMTTQQAEIVDTLYCAWNDFIIKGEAYDDARIVREVLTNWNESKARIPEEKWYRALRWMKAKGLVPHGFGQTTRRTEASR